MSTAQNTADPIVTADDKAAAHQMVRDLCRVAGSEQGVRQVLRTYGSDFGTDRAVDIALVALVVTFVECFDGPVPLNDTTTNPTTEGN